MPNDPWAEFADYTAPAAAPPPPGPAAGAQPGAREVPWYMTGYTMGPGAVPHGVDPRPGAAMATLGAGAIAAAPLAGPAAAAAGGAAAAAAANPRVAGAIKGAIPGVLSGDLKMAAMGAVLGATGGAARSAPRAPRSAQGPRPQPQRVPPTTTQQPAAPAPAQPPIAPAAPPAPAAPAARPASKAAPRAPRKASSDPEDAPGKVLSKAETAASGHRARVAFARKVAESNPKVGEKIWMLLDDAGNPIKHLTPDQAGAAARKGLRTDWFRNLWTAK